MMLRSFVESGLNLCLFTAELFKLDFSIPYNWHFSIGYTEDNLGNLGLSTGHVGSSLQICEKYPTKMARENHIASRSLPLESQGDFKLKVVKSWRGDKL